MLQVGTPDGQAGQGYFFVKIIISVWHPIRLALAVAVLGGLQNTCFVSDHQLLSEPTKAHSVHKSSYPSAIVNIVRAATSLWPYACAYGCLPAAVCDCAGESYGGVYVPLLMRALLQHNQRLKQHQQPQRTHTPAHTHTQMHANSKGTSQPGSGLHGAEERYNLAGYIVGNAVTDDIYDGIGQVEFAFGLGLIDPQTYHYVKQTCKVCASSI